MSLSAISHTIFLTSSLIFSFLWTSNPVLSSYNLQLAAILALIYFLLRLTHPKPQFKSILTSLVFTILLLLLIFSTGNMDSPFFFLLNFLLFTLALFFEPIQSVIFTFLLLLTFLTTPNTPLNTTNILNLASLILMTPLASLFGQKFLELKQQQGRINLIEADITQEETDTLLWLSTQAKPTLNQILSTISQVISSNRLPYHLQNKLKQTYKYLINLHQSADQLQKDVDQQTDD